MRILTFTSLFPNTADRTLGIFIYQRIVHVACHSQNTVCVVAPVPYFPSWLPLTKWKNLEKIPRMEHIGRLTVYHPRYFLVPKVSMYAHGLLMFLGCFALLRKLHRQIGFDCIDAHYVYPDGLAAVLAGRFMALPVVVSGRGSDITLLAGFRGIRQMARWTLRHASRCIAVSREIANRMVALGAPESKITVIGNGVDPTRFQAVDRNQARQSLGLPPRVRMIVAVGALVAVKNHRLLLEAARGILKQYPDLQVYVIGEGVLRAQLEVFAQRAGLGECVHFPGKCDNQELHQWYSAADVSCLSSSREGWPNVVLESLACGTPVVATRVGAVPEILISPDLGTIVEKDVAALRDGLCQALGRSWDRKRISDYALTRTWEDVAHEVEKTLQTAIRDVS
jgi:teichuronic acid biosynthesis glycosyltransferase TuaC